MRLLHTQSLRDIEFNPDSIPSYAILSHTWGDDEITYQDMQRLEEGGAAAVFGSRRVKQKKGKPKVEAAAGLAKRDGFDYIWIDTGGGGGAAAAGRAGAGGAGGRGGE